MSILLNNSDQLDVKISILEALDYSFGNHNLSEPEMIANLTYYLPDYLNSLSLNNIEFEAGGIFIHQKPYVAPCDPNNAWGKKYVELGDLLLVNNLVNNGQVLQRSALILQAKKIHINTAKRVVPDNPEQWDLYSNWPRFKYVTPSKLKNQERYIDCSQEMDIFQGAKYLLIDNDSKHCRLSDYVAKSTQPELTQFRPFCCEIFDFITGNAGKLFVTDVCDKCDIGWDRIIQDLKQYISKVVLSKKIRGLAPYQQINNATRGQGMCFLKDDNLKNLSIYAYIINNNIMFINQSSDGGDGGVPLIKGSEDNDGGISVIEITTLIGEIKKN